MLRRVCCTITILLALLHGPGVLAEPVTIKTDYARLIMDTDRLVILGWTVCYEPCDAVRNPAYVQELVTSDRPVDLLLAPPAIARWRLISRDDTALELSDEDQQSPAEAVQLRVALQTKYLLTIAISGRQRRDSESARLRLTPPAVFHREASEGFAASRELVEPLAVARNGLLLSDQLTAEPATDSQTDFAAPVLDWIGFRNRFWVLLASIDGDKAIPRYLPGADDRPGHWEVSLASDATINVYAGPLEPLTLKAVDPELGKVVFSRLWFWLRWLCLGMLSLLNAFAMALESWGGAIIALSVTVKILMTPLTRFAERWQAQVNRIQSQLQPRIDAIKRESKGEEQANRILAAHKELGVTPFYTFRSTLGFLIQIPVFLAAFNVLNEAVGLNGASFLWIDDLAQPDHFLALPFDIPFFGGYLNLLPVIMTAATLLAAWQLRDETLSDALRARRRQNLYGMATVFFLLFYTFPAGMVLYWTANTLLQSIWDILRRTKRPGLAKQESK